MSRHTIPRSDTRAAGWMRNFARTLAEEPEVYRASTREVEAVAESVALFRAAFAALHDRNARSMAMTRRKDDARAAAEAACRPVYARIKGDPQIDVPAKIRIGIRPAKGGRSRSAALSAVPTLGVDTRDGVHTVSWRDSGRIGRGKPSGCAMLQLFAATAEGEAGRAFDGAAGAAVAARGRLVNVYTSDRVRLLDGEMCGGGERVPSRRGVVTTVALVARWAGPRGQPGPWSRPAIVRLAA